MERGTDDDRLILSKTKIEIMQNTKETKETFLFVDLDVFDFVLHCVYQQQDMVVEFVLLNFVDLMI